MTHSVPHLSISQATDGHHQHHSVAVLALSQFVLRNRPLAVAGFQNEEVFVTCSSVRVSEGREWAY